MKKILSLFLTVSLLCGLLSTQAFAVEVAEEQGEPVVPSSTSEEPALQAAPSWGNDYDTTENFTISTVEELLAFSDMVNGSGSSSAKDFSGKTVTLSANLTLTDTVWKPIGTNSNTPFRGTFDGAKHTIFGLSYDGKSFCGLFGAIADATIYDLSIVDAKITCTGSAGVLVGQIDGKSKINSVSVSGTITQSPRNNGSYGGNLGGIAGTVGRSNKTDVTITNCSSNTCLSTQGGNVGGIVGGATTVPLNVSGCTNSGEVNGGEQTGGIVGGMSKGIVEGCSNTGAVTSASKRCGGIAGDITESSIRNCENTGAVSAGQSNEAGGIVGRVYAESTVEGCINTGTVSGDESVGGIAGSVVPYGFSSCTISDCTNSGSVSGTSNVGGIAGETSTKQANEGDSYKPNAEISACSNSGDVSGDANTGGIVGNHNKIAPASSPNNAGVTSAEVSGCINTGSVPEGGGAIVGTNNSESNGDTVKNPGVVENNFWPAELGNNAVGSGAGSSNSESAEAVKNNSSYQPDGTLTTPVKDSGGTEIKNLGDAIDRVIGGGEGGSENLPDAMKVTVTYDKNGHGTAPQSESVAMGKSVTLPNMDNDGYYTFTGWSDGSTTYAAGATVTVMKDTTFTAQWRDDTPSSGGGSSSSTTYAVSVEDSKNGSVSVSPKRAEKGDTVTITVKPDTGYELDELTVTDKNGDKLKLTEKDDGKFTFKMPGSKVTVEASFKLIETEPENPFTDISKSDYFYDAVLWAADKGITSGVTETLFAPNASCTRAQMVTFLWRANGSPVVDYAMDFTDVPADAYYADAVRWAVSKGITSGTSATTFAPDMTVTRAQTVTFLYRAAGTPAVSGGSFADVDANAYYADAVAWAVAEGITSGTSATTFSPDAACTRGQIVTFLYRAQ